MSTNTSTRVALIGGAAAVASHFAPAISWFFPLTKRVFPDLMGVRDPHEVALSFDDGPDPAFTPQVLEILRDANIKATFFMLGEMVRRYPAVARSVAAEGHEIALHGLSHRNSLLRSPRSIGYDLATAKEIIETTTGCQVTLMRPPYGVIAPATLWNARKLGLRIVLWTSWGRDWRRPATPETVLGDLLRHGLGGGTVLLHDSDCTSAPGSTFATIGALQALIETCAQRGLRLVPVGAPLFLTHQGAPLA